MVQETSNNIVEDSDDDETPEITYWEAIAWLAILTLWVSVLSGYLVDALQVFRHISLYISSKISSCCMYYSICKFFR